ncbi:MAG TPA: F0F1 ATP synthase subunit epsilon [Balneolaceae bacterium]|nr:F0F1 ATP synthase subunit epsilon [Balneolaceae bacterium]
MSWNKMMLNIMTPEKKIGSQSVDKIVAEARNGSFCLKPRHIDFLAELVPGILSFWSEGKEHLWAVNSGILVKKDDQVMVSVRHAVEGESLEELEQVVRKEFRVINQKEKETQIALEQLEADFIRRFVELQKR